MYFILAMLKFQLKNSVFLPKNWGHILTDGHARSHLLLFFCFVFFLQRSKPWNLRAQLPSKGSDAGDVWCGPSSMQGELFCNYKLYAFMLLLYAELVIISVFGLNMGLTVKETINMNSLYYNLEASFINLGDSWRKWWRWRKHNLIMI